MHLSFPVTDVIASGYLSPDIREAVNNPLWHSRSSSGSALRKVQLSAIEKAVIAQK
jgi:hypothetical protein